MTHPESLPVYEGLIQSLLANRPRLRKRLLQLHYEARVGHLGGNLSCLDILTTLFPLMDWHQDRFILSKGHSAGALYIALWSIGRMTDEELRSFHADRSQVGGHPSPFFKKEIPFFTGSLGHGLGLASGVALAKKLRQKPGTVYVLLSDGEWQEGSTWEAFNFALHHNLSNLRILVDLNGLQGFGRTDDVMSMADLPEKIASFGAPVDKCPGHDLAAILENLTRPTLAEPKNSSKGSPRVTFFETQKGHGISFMQDKLDWHYWSLNENQYQQALSEIDGVGVPS